MAAATISKEFKFEAAHHLPNHNGKCRGLHGHSYRAVVEYTGSIHPADSGPSEGMVLDFARVSERWKDIEPMLDHRNLNETIGPSVGPTTAENIAAWLLAQFKSLDGQGYLAGGIVTAVSVYETATSCVRVTRERAI